MVSLDQLSHVTLAAILAAMAGFYAGHHVGTDKVQRLEHEISLRDESVERHKALIISLSEILSDLMVDLTFSNLPQKERQALMKTITNVYQRIGSFG